MIGPAILLLVSAQPPGTDPSLALCKAALARKAEGEIGTIAVDSTTGRSRDLVIRGHLTLLLGMGPAPAGFARTHHLGRVDMSYRCRIRHGRIREAALNPLHP